jgi:RNA 2',3'-cyclic 3'-phosphodiesterase
MRPFAVAGVVVVRAFIAIEVPPVPGLVPPAVPGGAVAHLTLRFLGEVDAPTLDTVQRELSRELSDTPSFRFSLEGVDAFPSRERPRVVFLGVTAGRGELIDLARRISAAVARVGLPPDDRPFVPHVTVWRVRSPAHAARARALLAPADPGAPVIGEAREVLLVRSELTRQGAVHTPLARFPLSSSSPRDP